MEEDEDDEIDENALEYTEFTKWQETVTGWTLIPDDDPSMATTENKYQQTTTQER